MNEKEWMESGNPWPMLEFLKRKVSKRKLQLFAVACCRRIWHLLTDQRSRDAIALVEISDGVAVDKKRSAALDEKREVALANAQATCVAVSISDLFREPTVLATRSAYHVISQGKQFVGHAAMNAAYAIAVEAGCREPKEFSKNPHYCIELRTQCAFLHDIFGNPYRPVLFSTDWLTPPVFSLAQIAYEERNLPLGTLDNTRLAILADALEDAGASGTLLEHLRSEGPHVRGCFALDLILAKE